MPKPQRRLSAADTVVWDAWSKVTDLSGAKLQWDVEVGGPVETPGDFGPKLQSLWVKLRSRRVDLVVTWPDEVWVTEFKPILTLQAVGQALGYAWLWQRDHPLVSSVVPLLVCGRTDSEAQQFAESVGVTLYALDVSAAALELTLPRRLASLAAAQEG